VKKLEEFKLNQIGYLGLFIAVLFFILALATPYQIGGNFLVISIIVAIPSALIAFTGETREPTRVIDSRSHNESHIFHHKTVTHEEIIRQKYCSHCGTAMNKSASFCPYCGANSTQ
jgi:predicted membrane protein